MWYAQMCTCKINQPTNQPTNLVPFPQTFPSYSWKYRIYTNDIQIYSWTNTALWSSISQVDHVFPIASLISVYAIWGPQTHMSQNWTHLSSIRKHVYGLVSSLFVNGTIIYLLFSAQSHILSSHLLFILHFYYCNSLWIKQSALYSHPFMPIF